MRDDMIITRTTLEDLSMIVSALSAYQHNDRYRALYQRLVRQIENREYITLGPFQPSADA